jgi:membrane protease YdiL (CAAX protease family)
MLMDQLLLFVPFLLPVLAANISERHRLAPYQTRDPQRDRTLDKAIRYLPHGLLVVINLGLLGISALALLNGMVQLLMPGTLEPSAQRINWLVVAITAFLTALLACLPLLPAVRAWLARRLPIDPDSLVHMTALAFAVYQIGLSLGQIALIGDLENLIDPALSLSIWDVLLSGVPLLLFALAGVGLWIRRGGRGTWDRLGLRWPTWRQLIAAAGITVLLLAFDFLVNWSWQEVAPTSYDLLQRVSENIFGGLATMGGALALGLSAGISEELLFRGAVQPRLGLLLTTVLFAIGHLQYGLTVATLEVFVIGLVLGLVRKRSHTTVCILIHAAYNGVGTLLGTF